MGVADYYDYYDNYLVEPFVQFIRFKNPALVLALIIRQHQSICLHTE